LVFTGTYEHTIDGKQRVAIPAGFRRKMARDQRDPDEPLCMYVTLGEQQCLCLYTEDGFEQRARELDSSDLDATELLEYERILFSQSALVELDKQGRVRLPEHLLRRTNLGTEVVLIGVKDHVEIRDRQTWQTHLDTALQQRPDLLMNPRRAMRRPQDADA